MIKIFNLLWKVIIKIRWRTNLRVASMLQRFFASDYKKRKVSLWKIYSIHRKGFTVDDWCVMDLENKDCKKYLSNVQYCKMHPINGRYSMWIDDKLTLKYLCHGTELDKYMPEYYFQIDSKGKVLALMDYCADKRDITSGDVADFLIEKKELAIKLISGSIGAGFFKAEFHEGAYFLNGNKMDRKEFCKKLDTLRDYLIVEYLRPHSEISKYCPNTVNTIRYLVGRIDGQLRMIKGYVRFGTKNSGFVENYNAGGVLCYLDECGYFEEGNVIDRESNKNVVIKKHPDSNEGLKGSIPLWEEIMYASQLFDKVFPQLDYLGIDFVVTSKNEVKILEVNSLTSLDGLEMKSSILETDEGIFYKNRM